MENYPKASYALYDCKYHVVWTTRYRKRILTGFMAERMRELIKQICKEHDVDLIKERVSKDHIHLFVSIPPHVAISKVVQYLKRKSSYRMMQENKKIFKEFWGRHLWERGYFVATSGEVTDEVIMEYIENQDEGKTDDYFKISI